MNREFLPLCDVLFNIISLVSYFCDVVFDVITIYTMYEQGRFAWFAIALLFCMASLSACQVMSATWYIHSDRRLRRHQEEQCENEEASRERHRPCVVVLAMAAHVLQCGVLWRYFVLFVPVDMRGVKLAVRDLCLLRLTHGFFQAAPMLLIQLFDMWQVEALSRLPTLSVVSSALSLFSVCWALASFNKHLRPHNLHKLALTWLGVIYQFLWRLGTVSSRVAALSLYATRYHFWALLVMGLHWATTFLWLLSRKDLFRGEKLSRRRRSLLSLLISYVYVFCYINVQSSSAGTSSSETGNVWHNMLAFYVVMFLENSLLATVWLGQESGSLQFKYFGASVVWGGFAGGIVFMLLYYRYFHIQQHESRSDELGSLPRTHSGCTHCQLGTCSVHSVGRPFGSPAVSSRTGALDEKNHFAADHLREYHVRRSAVADHNGVFNCRLNPALKRKKKKPTTFIPIPAVRPVSSSPVTNGEKMAPAASVPFQKSDVPFWKRRASAAKLPGVQQRRGERDVDERCSRFNIQQKLREKRQKQLQELRVIEEEIKQGKLQRPHLPDIGEQGTLRQPIPRSKKQPWVPPDSNAAPPELLLSAQHLESERFYYDCGNEKWQFTPPVGDGNGWPAANGIPTAPSCNGHCPSGKYASNGEPALLYKSYRNPSDLDSQISLPRSYTLPREFRYHRKPKLRKAINSEHFVTSNNSNDGDVDSGEEYGDGGSETKKSHGEGFQAVGIVPRMRPGCGGPHLIACNMHETKL